MQYTIRTWRPSDAADLAAAMDNPNILENLRDGIPYSYTQADAREYIRTMLGAEPGSQYAFAINVDDRAVGSIGIFRQVNTHFRTTELGYYVTEPYRGQGIYTSTMRQICGYVFQSNDILRIFAGPFARGATSCRILEKMGFILEGILRKNALKNGETLDTELCSLIK